MQCLTIKPLVFQLRIMFCTSWPMFLHISTLKCFFSFLFPMEGKGGVWFFLFLFFSFRSSQELEAIGFPATLSHLRHISQPRIRATKTRNIGVGSTGSSKGRAFFSLVLSGPIQPPQGSWRPAPTWNSLQEKGSECPAPRKHTYALVK